MKKLNKKACLWTRWSVLVLACLGIAHRASADNYWWGCVSSDPFDVKNYWNGTFNASALTWMKATDVENYGGEVKSFTLDFKGQRLEAAAVAVADGSLADFTHNPIVWTDTSEGGQGGFASNASLYVGGLGRGDLHVDGGVHRFLGDILVSENNGTGHLTLNGGELRSRYWLASNSGSSSQETEITITGGLLSLGDTDQKQGAIDLCRNGGKTTWKQTGGTVYAPGSKNGDTWGLALMAATATGSSADLTISGGVMTLDGSATLGQGSDSSAKLTIDGGELNILGDLMVGQSSAAKDVAVYLNGGTLKVRRVRTNLTGETKGLFSVNGGTLKARSNQMGETEGLIPVNEHLTVSVGKGGAIIDTDYGVEIGHPLVSGVEEGTDGGLVKRGSGRLLLSGAADYTGDTVIEEGALAVTAGCEFKGALTIGSHGVIEVQIPDATAESLAVDSQIRLFKATAVNIEYENDTLADVVFLTGKVFGYTLAIDDEGWIVATVTDVAKLTLTRKLTTFVAVDNYIDQDASWSNGQPVNDSYDIIVFTRDATMNVHAWNWGAGANRACDQMVLRGATVLAQSLNDWNPSLDKRHIIGHGTLQLRRLGLQCRTYDTLGSGGPIVGKNITVEIVKTALDHDTWCEEPVIYGTFKVTTGQTIFNSNSKLYGDAYFLNPNKVSYIAKNSTGNYIGGIWTIGDGCTFDFNGNSVEFGENAKLVFKGRSSISNVGSIKFPVVVLGDGYQKDASALNDVTKGYILDGGTIVLDANSKVSEATPLTVVRGMVLVDMATLTVTDDTATLPNVTFTGTAEDFTAIKVVGGNSKWEWTASLGENGAIILTKGDARDGVNHWIGAENGSWAAGVNWTLGIPVAGQTCQVDASTTILMNEVGTVGNLVIPEGVRLLLDAAGNDTYKGLNLGQISGKGTIALRQVGLMGTAEPREIGPDLTLEIVDKWVGDARRDCWFESDKGNNSAIRLKVHAPLTGNGQLVCRRWVEFDGDNSGFTGLFRNEASATWFTAPQAGLENSEGLNMDGSLYVWFHSGTIRFSGLTMNGTGDHGINVPLSAGKDKPLVIEVGANDKDVSMTGQQTYGAYRSSSDTLATGWTDGCEEGVIFRKIGSGTFRCNFGQPAHVAIEIANGLTQFVAPDMSAMTVTARAGATLTGGSPIGTLNLEPGVKIAQTVQMVTSTETVTDEEGNESQVTKTTGMRSAATLQAKNAQDITGVIFEVLNPEVLPAATMETTADWTEFAKLFEVVGGPYLIGRMITAEGKGYSPAGSTAGLAWRVRRQTNGVILTVDRAKPGLMLIIR